MTLKYNYFLVNAPDQPNSQRAKHGAEHLQQNAPLAQSGYVVVGGALLPTGAVSSDADALAKLVGSVIIVKAESVDHVWETLKKDVFYTSGEVWDNTKITVTPVYIGVPQVE
ncbi:hypothetical protein C8Q76DRAFT_198115 [Earliella scabrosa]|nr:hypothetical protein C8Q76DRAFT_198115 [Earliella scabrosa]